MFLNEERQMNIVAKLISQTKKPTGIAGLILTKAMNRAHSRITNWGLHFLEIDEGHKILEIGCGGGKTIYKLAQMFRNGKVYGIDHSDVSVKSSTKLNSHLVDQNRVEIQKASVSSIPYPAEFFDVITAIETYFFWPNLENDMKEVLRVLRPKGKLLLVSEIVRRPENEKTIDRFARLANTSDYMRYKTKEELNQIFIDAGYGNVTIHENKKHGWICAVGCKPYKEQEKES